MKKILPLLFIYCFSHHASSQVMTRGLIFDGYADYISVPHHAAYDLGQGDFTVESWINASSFQVASSPTIIGNRFYNTNYTYSGFMLFLSGGQLRLQMNGINLSSAGNDLRDNACHHVAVTRSSGTVNYYVDGNLVSTQAGASQSINTPHDIWMGKDERITNPFNGLIHEVRFWSVARSHAEILAAKDTFLTGLETGLAGYWRMNGLGQTVTDYSPTNNSGVWGSSPLVENLDPYSSPNGCFVNPCLPQAVITASGPTSFCPPGTVTLSANTGIGLSYQWRKNNINISGATSSTYVAQLSGNYICLVSNTCGTSTSNAISVVAYFAPTINIFTNGSTTFCAPAILWLNSQLSSPIGLTISYQWTLNGVPINGATTGSYQAGITGNYVCTATNICGSTNSNTITLTVNPIPVASITASGATSFCTGGTVVLNANTGTGLSYQWHKNGAAISGASVSSYTAASSGSYTVVVTNSCGTTTSNAIVVSQFTSAPAKPGSISGPSSFCSYQAGIVYSISPVANATQYNWTLPQGAIITSGQGSTSITVTFGNKSGNIRVAAVNSCGTSPYQQKKVTKNCREAGEDFVEEISAIVYPNPSTDHFTLKLNAAGETDFILILHDLAGRETARIEKSASSEAIQFGQDLAPGVYFAKLIAGEYSKTFRLVKEN